MPSRQLLHTTASHLRILGLFLGVFCTAAATVTPAAGADDQSGSSPTAYQPGPMLQRFLDGPMAGCEEIVFAVRVPGRDHWYVTFGNYASFLPEPGGPSLQGRGWCLLGLWRGRTALPAESADRQADGAAGGSRRAASAIPQLHYDGQKILFCLPQGRNAPVPPLRDQHRRHRADAADRRAGRRHRADLLPGREHRLLLVALPAVRQLLVHARGHALSLRCRRLEHPHALEQQRPRQHAVDAARRPRALHAMGVRRPQPGPLPPPVDDEPRRHGPDGLLRQPARRHRHARRQADPGHATRWSPPSRRVTGARNIWAT